MPVAPLFGLFRGTATGPPSCFSDFSHNLQFPLRTTFSDFSHNMQFPLRTTFSDFSHNMQFPLRTTFSDFSHNMQFSLRTTFSDFSHNMQFPLRTTFSDFSHNMQFPLRTTFSSLPLARKAANHDLHKNMQTVLCVMKIFVFFLFVIMHIFIALHQYCENIH